MPSPFFSSGQAKRYGLSSQLATSRNLIKSSLPLYEGDYIEGLLLMTEMAYVRHQPVSDRLNFLPICIEMLSPSAWLHHDTLTFVQSIAQNSWQMHILRSDLADDFARRRW